MLKQQIVLPLFIAAATLLTRINSDTSLTDFHFHDLNLTTEPDVLEIIIGEAKRINFVYK